MRGLPPALSRHVTPSPHPSPSGIGSRARRARKWCLCSTRGALANRLAIDTASPLRDHELRRTLFAPVRPRFRTTAIHRHIAVIDALFVARLVTQALFERLRFFCRLALRRRRGGWRLPVGLGETEHCIAGDGDTAQRSETNSDWGHHRYHAIFPISVMTILVSDQISTHPRTEFDSKDRSACGRATPDIAVKREAEPPSITEHDHEH